MRYTIVITLIRLVTITMIGSVRRTDRWTVRPLIGDRMARPRKTFNITQARVNESHRVAPDHRDTAHCAFWLSPEQLNQAHTRHVAAGRQLTGEVACPCGNHMRRTYR